MQTSDNYTPKRLLAADPEIAARLAARQAEIDAGAATGTRTRAGLALGGALLATAALSHDVFAQGGLPSMVVDILNFALTLEHLEAEFYVTGVATSGLIPASMHAPFDQIRKHEVAHVAFLRSVLGSSAIEKPTFDFTGGAGSGSGPFADVFRNAQTFMAVAQAFEDTGVRAYKGQAANLMGHNDVLRAALKIHSVEARHAAQVRRMRGQKGWITLSESGGLPEAAQATYKGESNRFQFILGQPESNTQAQTEAFDETLTKHQVLEIVEPFIAGAR
ncbi:MAG: ferritin-like domain-containing protein [Gemmatimonadota bacterium]|nr:ferritin-like domain-containing protein [Gemmatimonadota bacterium]